MVGGQVAVSGGNILGTTSGALDFPLISARATSSQNKYNLLATVQRMARFDYVTIGNSYVNGGSTGYGGTMSTFVAAIKSNSSVNTKVGMYTIADTIVQPTPNYPDYYTNETAANNWILYQVGTSGTKTPNYYNGSYWGQNITTYVPNDGSGMKVCDSWMKYIYHYHVVGDQGGTYQSGDYSTQIDIIDQDNLFLQIVQGGETAVNTPSGTGTADYTRDGTSDYQQIVGPPSGATISQAQRDGLALGVNWIRNNASVKFYGNLAGWGDTTQSLNNQHFGGTNVTGIDGIVQGGLCEWTFGVSYAMETRLGFSTTKTNVQFVRNHIDTGAPLSLGGGYDATGYDYTDHTNAWRAARYQFCFTLQANQYFTPALISSPYTSGNYDITALIWLDEFAINAGTNTAVSEANFTQGMKYLGQPIDPEWTVLGNGVYARRYVKGADTWVVFCNPKANGSQTFNIGTYFAGKQFQRFNGSQDSTSNDGSTVSSLTMPDRSGWIGRLV